MNEYPISAERLHQIETAFTYHAPKGDQYDRYQEIRSTARTFAKMLVMNCPEGRNLSLALTKLEEAVMHANAAIARGEADEDTTVTKA